MMISLLYEPPAPVLDDVLIMAGPLCEHLSLFRTSHVARADAAVRAPLRREKSFSARSFDADDHPVHALNTDESWSSAGRIGWLKLACSLTQVFAAVPAHTERGDGEQCGSQLKVGYA